MPRQVATPIKLDIFWPKVPKTVQEKGEGEKVERGEKEKKAGKLQMMIMDGGVDAADGDGRAGQGRAGGECKVRLRLWVLLVVVLLGCLSGCWGWC